MIWPRDARVAVGGWRLFDLVVQVNELALTTFVPGDTLGKPRKLMGKNRKHVGAERESMEYVEIKVSKYWSILEHMKNNQPIGKHWIV